MATAAASTSATAAVLASRLLRRSPRQLRRLSLSRAAPAAALSSSSRPLLAPLARQPLGHRARMGHTAAAAAAAAAGPALGLTKPNAVEPPQVTFSAKDVEFSEWKGDILAVAVTEKDLSKDSDSKFENAVLKKLDGQLGGLLSEVAAEEDFTGKAGQSVVLRLAGQGFKRVGLIGLGQSAPSTAAASRGLGESVASVAKAAQASSAAIVFANPSGIQEEFKLTAAAAIASGTVLGLYEDIRYKSESKKVHLKQVDIIGLGAGPEVDQKLKYANDLSSGVIFGRELVNSPANVLTPAVLAEEASKIASAYSDVFTATILDEEKCKELKMGQYGAPGTEYNSYATGTYVGTSPMGPFTYAPYNPVGYKPGGFVQGAGHGNTFQDLNGNWWNTGTPWIGYNWTFERRIGMWPTVFDADGQMRVSTRFGDFPQRMPTARFTDPDALFTGWMLLSYRKAATASASVAGHGPADATDENPRSFWLSPTKAAGATLTIDLGAVKTVRAVQVNFADYQAGRFGDAPDIYTEFRLEQSLDGRTWRPLARTEAPRRDRSNAYFELPAPVRTRYVRYVHGHIGGAHLAISDLRVFGSAGGAMPGAPTLVAATRGADTRDATIRWRRVPGAVGYNVRWGIRPDRLALTYQVFADRVADGDAATLPLRALTVGQRYYVAVEAFDENGVSSLSRVAAM